jgi:hypothetical protein
VTTKYREFWILKTPGGEFIEYDEPMNMDWTCCKKIHVIEKSAVDDLQAKYDALLGVFEKYRAALNSCENYLNWNADELSGDDNIGDGRRTMSYKNQLEIIRKALKENNNTVKAFGKALNKEGEK